MSQKRNYTLDLIKLIAAFMVVFIHVPFSGKFGVFVSGIACFAVPLFFVTSGYFCYLNDNQTVKRKLSKIFVILVLSSLLYNVTNIITGYLSLGQSGIFAELSVYADLSRWKDLLLFNLPFSATRLWFLLALIYVYVIQLFLNKVKVTYKTIFIFSLVGLFINLLIGEVLSLFGVALPAHYIRNFLLTGFPFFGIGMYINHKEQVLLRIPSISFVVLLAIGVVLTVTSIAFKASSTLYFGSVLITLPLFILALRGNNIRYSPFLIKLFACSLGIYIFHRPVTTICSLFLSVLGFSQKTLLFDTALPLFVCIATTVVTLIYNAVLKSIRSKLKNNKYSSSEK